jgi:hypothetical protein
MQNFQTLGALRVTHRVARHREPAYYRDLAFQLEYFKQLLGDPTLDSDTRGVVADQIKSIEPSVSAASEAPGEPIELPLILNQVWTDHERFQVRAPDERIAEGFEFPTEEIKSGSEIARYFREIKILSWSPDQDVRAWVWYGGAADGVPTGLVSRQSPHLLLDFRFPALGYIRSEWAPDERWHPFDQLLGGDLKSLSVHSEAVLDGVRTFVVERRVLQTSASGDQGGTGVEVLLRGWIDPARGWLPIRTEKSLQPFKAGSPKGPRTPAIEVVTASAIEKLDEFGYYPMQVRREIRSDDSRVAVTRTSGTEAPLPEAAMFTAEVELWEVLDITHHAQIASEMFAAGLPDGAIFGDTDRQQFYVVGDPEHAIDLISASAPAEFVADMPRSHKAIIKEKSFPWLLLANVVAIVVLFGIVALRRVFVRKS